MEPIKVTRLKLQILEQHIRDSSERPNVFKLGEIQYQFITDEFIFDGTKITAMEAIKDKNILATLVEINSGIIQKI